MPLGKTQQRLGDLTKDDINFPKHLTEDNAWIKDYDYNYRDDNPKSNYRFVNKITKEQRPLTEAQYNDTSYTLNER